MTVSHLPHGDTERKVPSECKTDQERIKFVLETIPKVLERRRSTKRQIQNSLQSQALELNHNEVDIIFSQDVTANQDSFRSEKLDKNL